MKCYCILIFLLVYQSATAQFPIPEFGTFSPEEINLKECPFDKKAEAVILLDYAVASHDDEYKLITRRRIRIKILHQREVDRGNITIRFYSKDKFEFIDRVKGITYNNNENGNFDKYTLENKSIYTVKENDFYSTVKFALPAVKAGSIIEYEYESNMQHYGGLDDWDFQNDIPTFKSCFLLTIIPGASFQYSIQKKINYPITVKPMLQEGKIYFEMNNIPGLKYEPYMDAVRDYLQRVSFQLSGFTMRTGGQVKINQTWKDLAYDLSTEKDFGGAIKKDLSNLDEIKKIVTNETSESGKVAAIYNYVRNNFTWNGYYSKYAVDGIKNVWEKRKGTAGEINLLLVNLLQTFKIEAYPMLVAERDYGKVDSTYPFLDRFNKVAVFARAEGKTFILDATRVYTPPGLTPYPLLNTMAFIVDKKNHSLVRILTKTNAYNNSIKVDAKLGTDGLLKGNGQIISSGYAREIRTEKIKKQPANFIKDILQETGTDWIVDSCTFENLDDDKNPLVQNIRFHSEQSINGGFVFINCNMFTGFNKNPFTADERFTNINFGYPYRITLQAAIQLPANSKADKLPADKNVTSSDNSLIVSRKMRIENNVLLADIEFTQTITLIGYDRYHQLKAIYKEAIDLMNEPVVVKLGN